MQKRKAEKGTEMQEILEDNPKVSSNFVCERKRHNRFGDDRQKKTKIYMVWTNLVFYCFWEREEKSIDYCIELYCFYRIGIAAVLV